MAGLNQILDLVRELSPDELRQLRDAVDDRLAWDGMTEDEREDAFERDLLRRGIISRIPDRSKATPEDQRPPLIEILSGEPVSETIIRERR